MAKLTQEELLKIFYTVKKQVQPYEKDHIKARFDIEGKYDLWTEKPGMVIMGKPRAEVAFTAIIVQSSYVGFYFMPIYCSEAVRGQLSPDFLKLLKGKACFHIKTTDADVINNIKAAMKVGYEAYKKMGWV